MPEIDPKADTQEKTLTEVGHTPSPGTSPSGDERVGRNFAHFRVEGRLGSGGMGEVYTATDLALDRKVALKFLGREVAGSPQLRERFLREARAQARLNHPNVGHIYFVGEEDGQLFFAMELIEGQSLQGRLDRDEKVPPGEALELCRQAALGLREAHRHGFTHRDIKPSNLMLDRHGAVKIVDFGIVKQAPAEGQDVGLTQEKGGTLLGTPHYMAPEQARGDKVDFRADIYSLGATLHHLIAGKPPFDGDTALQVVARHLSDPRPRLTDKRQFTRPPSNALADDLIERMMAKRPDDRFASYDDLLATMERLSPTFSRPAGFWVRAFAFGIDFLVAILLTLPIEMLWGSNIDDAVLVLAAIYSIFTHARWGRTIGKAALDLEVVPWERAGRLGFVTAAKRFLWQCGLTYVLFGTTWVLELYGLPGAEIPGLVGLAIPLIFGGVAVFTPSKRTLWDKHSGTLVRYRR
jgi:serine/threonine protein kinase